MKKLIVFSFMIGLMAVGSLTLFSTPAEAATAATCQSFGGGSMKELSTTEISVFCNTASTVYFGVCDSGSAQDDLFTLTLNEGESINFFEGERERVNLGIATVPGFGFYTAQLTSISKTDPATPFYAISTDLTQVQNFLFIGCGVDYNGLGYICSRPINIYVDGTVPEAGELYLMGRFGELNRYEGIRFLTIKAEAGAVVNNIAGVGRGPTYIRLWWKPSDSDNYYLLPSQYWESGGNGGTVDSEYGLSCEGGVPSYHTSWDDLIIDEEVPLLDINNDGEIEIIPTLTVQAQQTATAQAQATPTPNQ